EEYGRADVESAIEAFEKSQPHLGLAPKALAPERQEEGPKAKAGEDSAREPLAQWLGEEPERPAPRPEPAAESATTADLSTAVSLGLTGLPSDLESQETIAMKIPETPAPVAEKSAAAPPEEISEEQAKTLFDVPSPPPLFLPGSTPPPAE